MIGSSFSHFRVTSKLGEGGMGEVWQAEDTKLGREVALKVLPDVFAQDPDRLARFEREARVLASLSHTNIAGVHGLEEVDGKRFLVMELVTGETVAERIQRGPIPVDEVARIAMQIAEAVESAHEKGVIHRDLKPGNIMLSNDGEVKIMDFSIAHVDVGFEGHDTEVQGSPMYMPPEQILYPEVDGRADVYAIAIMMLLIRAGR